MLETMTCLLFDKRIRKSPKNIQGVDEPGTRELVLFSFRPSVTRIVSFDIPAFGSFPSELFLQLADSNFLP
jgi:hypothetical protein